VTELLADAPQWLTDPAGAICAVVAAVEPGLPVEQITAAMAAVTAFRPAQRKLARALRENPGALTSGRAESIPMVDELIRTLRQCGGHRLMQPVCASCGKPRRGMHKYNGDGLRICVTCDNRASGRFTPQPCANCGKVLTPRTRDRNGGPRCEWCPPEPDIDHVAVIASLVMANSSFTDRAALRELILGCVRQPARRRQLAWDLQDNPDLLRGQGASGSPTVRRLLPALRKAGVDIETARCPFCNHPGRKLETVLDGRPCCSSCYQATRRTECTRCQRNLPITARTADGLPLCGDCTKKAEFNHGTCNSCGELKPIATRRHGQSTCFDCRTMPVAQCATCGNVKPCRYADSATPRCPNCRARANAQPCARCGKTKPVSTRGDDGNPLCHSCSRKPEECGACHRMMLVAVRVGDEARCSSCARSDPALFRDCIKCGVFGPIRQAGRCERCAAPYVLHRQLADSTNSIPARLQPVYDALAVLT
jgi:hypothetical protein